MSSTMSNMRASVKRRFSHKNPELKDTDFDDDEASADEETSSYINKEVEHAEKEGERYPLGRPNSFLNRMISHGNKKTEEQLARDAAEHEARNKAAQASISGGRTTGAGQSASGATRS